MSYSGVDGLTQRLSNMRQFVQQQINTLTAKQACTVPLLSLPVTCLTLKPSQYCAAERPPCLCGAHWHATDWKGSFLGSSANLAGGMQDDTLAAQAALEKQLAAVGDDVDDINTRVGEVRSPAQAALPEQISVCAREAHWPVQNSGHPLTCKSMRVWLRSNL